MPVRHTRRARADLLDIWLEIASKNPAVADRLYDRLEARVRVLGDHPEIGTARPDISAETRMLVEGSYVILYRIRADGVQVVRVLHGARDIDQQVFEEGG